MQLPMNWVKGVSMLVMLSQGIAVEGRLPRDT
jgi:hypothetical protein